MAVQIVNAFIIVNATRAGVGYPATPYLRQCSEWLAGFVFEGGYRLNRHWVKWPMMTYPLWPEWPWFIFFGRALSIDSDANQTLDQIPSDAVPSEPEFISFGCCRLIMTPNGCSVEYPALFPIQSYQFTVTPTGRWVEYLPMPYPLEPNGHILFSFGRCQLTAMPTGHWVE